MHRLATKRAGDALDKKKYNTKYAMYANLYLLEFISIVCNPK